MARLCLVTTTSQQLGDTSPAASADGLYGRLPRRAWLPLELAIVAALVFAYDRIHNLAETRTSLSFHDGFQVLTTERHLGLAFELPANVWLAAHHQLAEISSWYYQLAHLTVTLLVLVACYIYRPDIYRAARNALVLINVVGLVVFWVYPVAPPRLLPGSGFIDVTQVTGVAAAASSTAAPNQYAAMPSLHTAWAVWVAVIVFLLVRVWWVRVLSVVHPVLTVMVIITTGNHYFLDAVAGAAVALAAAAVVGLLPGLWWFEADREGAGDAAPSLPRQAREVEPG